MGSGWPVDELQGTVTMRHRGHNADNLHGFNAGETQPRRDFIQLHTAKPRRSINITALPSLASAFDPVASVQQFTS